MVRWNTLRPLPRPAKVDLMKCLSRYSVAPIRSHDRGPTRPKDAIPVGTGVNAELVVWAHGVEDFPQVPSSSVELLCSRHSSDRCQRVREIDLRGRRRRWGSPDARCGRGAHWQSSDNRADWTRRWNGPGRRGDDWGSRHWGWLAKDAQIAALLGQLFDDVGGTDLIVVDPHSQSAAGSADGPIFESESVHLTRDGVTNRHQRVRILLGEDKTAGMGYGDPVAAAALVGNDARPYSCVRGSRRGWNKQYSCQEHSTQLVPYAHEPAWPTTAGLAQPRRRARSATVRPSFVPATAQPATAPVAALAPTTAEWPRSIARRRSPSTQAERHCADHRRSRSATSLVASVRFGRYRPAHVLRMARPTSRTTPRREVAVLPTASLSSSATAFAAAAVSLSPVTFPLAISNTQRALLERLAHGTSPLADDQVQLTPRVCALRSRRCMTTTRDHAYLDCRIDERPRGRHSRRPWSRTASARTSRLHARNEPILMQDQCKCNLPMRSS